MSSIQRLGGARPDWSRAPGEGGRIMPNIPHNNLPHQLTSFVGRERELAEVQRLLGTTRLLTVTGAGGIGKTRFALHVATDRLGSYPDGVWFVDLAPLFDPALVARTLASAAGVPEQSGR